MQWDSIGEQSTLINLITFTVPTFTFEYLAVNNKVHAKNDFMVFRVSSKQYTVCNTYS